MLKYSLFIHKKLESNFFYSIVIKGMYFNIHSNDSVVFLVSYETVWNISVLNVRSNPKHTSIQQNIQVYWYLNQL